MTILRIIVAETNSADPGKQGESSLNCSRNLGAKQVMRPGGVCGVWTQSIALEPIRSETIVGVRGVGDGAG